MSYIDITNFVTVSVSSPPVGFAEYQVNNLAIFTKDIPVNVAITQANPGVYRSTADVLADWGSNSEAYAMAQRIFAQSPNILDGNGQLVIVPMGVSDTLDVVIPLVIQTIFFGGALWAGYAPNDVEVLAASTACQSLRVKLFASSHLTSALTTTTGLFWKIQNASEKHTRCLLYLLGASAQAARYMASAYAGRAMSVNFNGVATTQTMNLKTLVSVLPDTSITQTVLNSCIAVGADSYPSVGAGAQYVGKVYSTGANGFFDDVYNEDWIVFALQIAGINALTETSTKLPQTEQGMAVLKGSYLRVLQQGVTNGYVAPGTWNSPELFGNPVDLRRSVENLGYYVWSQPVNQQSQQAREAREAPIVRIAIKLAGAIHKTNVVVSVNK